MDPATPSVISAASAPVVGRSDLPDLANFRDASGHAVSFFFSVQSIPDKSHHTEVTLVRAIWCGRSCTASTPEGLPGLAEDLEAVLALAEEVRENPRYGGSRMHVGGRDSGGSLNCLRRNRSDNSM